MSITTNVLALILGSNAPSGSFVFSANNPDIRRKFVFSTTGVNGSYNGSGSIVVRSAASRGGTVNNLMVAFSMNVDPNEYRVNRFLDVMYIRGVTGPTSLYIEEITGVALDYEYSQPTYNELIKIESISAINSNSCSNNIQYTVITNHPISKYRIGAGNIISSGGTVFTIDSVRDVSFTLRVFNTPGFSDEYDTQFVNAANTASNITGEVDYIASGAIVSILHDGSNVVAPKYSINGIDFFDSPIFSKLQTGEYDLYVLDGFGCLKMSTEKLIVDTETFFSQSGTVFFPRANTFHWASDEDVNFCDNYPRLSNTLSFMERGLNLDVFKHLVQHCDTVTNQFTSSYSNHRAFIKTCSGSTEISVFKITDNRIKTISLDSYRRNYEGKLSYAFDNSVPSYVSKGSFITIRDESIDVLHKIQDIVYNEEFPNGVIVFNELYVNGSGANAATYSYELDPYDYFEIRFDASTLDGDYYLEMQAGSGSFMRSWFSEVFNVQKKHEETFFIESSNSENNQIFYNGETPIKHFMRLPYERTKVLLTGSEVEDLITDTKRVHKEGRVDRAWRFILREFPTAIADKLEFMLVQDQVFVDGEPYVTPSYEAEVIGQTNIYRVTFEMFESGDILNTNSKRDLLINSQAGFIRANGDGTGLIGGGGDSFILNNGGE